MTFFVDANVLIYARAESERGAPCAAILEAIARGAPGRTSTAVIEEAWHVELSRSVAGLDGVARYAYAIFTPLISVTDEVIRVAKRLETKGIGTADRVHAATCLVSGIEMIVTADASFDQIRDLRRVDPFDERAIRGLLAAS